MNEYPNRTLSKQCHVCGDVAVAFNHNGLSCQSCKMFFRRNFLRSQELKCKHNKNCTIDKCSRSKCAKCRLDKCFTVGMKQDSIGKNSTLEKGILKNIDNVIVQNLTANDDCLDQQEVENPLSISRIVSTSLTEPELCHIVELQNAMEFFVDESRLEACVNPATLSLAEAFNLHALYARSIIKFCKNIQAFTHVNANDQETMLKGIFHEINFIRFTYLFNPQKRVVKMIGNEKADNAVEIDIAQTYAGNQQFPYFQMLKYKLHSLLKDDPTLRDLLIGILLFKPRENIISREFIKYEHMIYSRLLYRYLTQKYADLSMAEDTYWLLLSLLTNIESIREEILKVVIPKIDLSQLNQVLREVHEI